jgi:hypothetical protein
VSYDTDVNEMKAADVWAGVREYEPKLTPPLTPTTVLHQSQVRLILSHLYTLFPAQHLSIHLLSAILGYDVGTFPLIVITRGAK